MYPARPGLLKRPKGPGRASAILEKRREAILDKWRDGNWTK